MKAFVKGRRGFALLELLVAMAILAIAIYAALKFFPRGLATIEHQRMVTVATRLAQAEAERWQSGEREPPFAIALVRSGWPETGSGVILDRETRPAALDVWLEQAVFDPTTPTPRGGLLVIREEFEVPPPINGECRYVLSYGPPAFISGRGAAAVVYNPQPFERANVADSSQLGPRQYMVANWTTGTFVVQPAAEQRSFKIDFTVAERRDRVFDFLVTLPANSSFLSVNQPVVENSERIYEVYPASVTSVNEWGVVRFAPPFAGRRVAVDYILADPHIIGEEIQIPPAEDRDGDGNLDPVPERLSLYHLLAEPLSPNHPFNIVAVDLETGEIYTEGGGIFSVDWRNGMVEFDPTLGGKKVKVYYKSADRVTLLPLKSPSVYVQYLQPDGNHPTGRVLVGKDDLNASIARKAPFPRQFDYTVEADPSDGALMLLFLPSEAGQAIAVDYVSVRAERGEILSIPEVEPYEVTLQRRPVVQPLLSVRGVGFKVRICWMERGGRVRKTDLDVVLPPERAG